MLSLPYMKIYPGDEYKSAARNCSVGARGLWNELRMIMHTCPRYGYLEHDGKPISPETLALRCAVDQATYNALLSELTAARIPSFTNGGVMYCQEMVQEEAKRLRVARDRAKAGKKGMETRWENNHKNGKSLIDNDIGYNKDNNKPITNGLQTYEYVNENEFSGEMGVQGEEPPTAERGQTRGRELPRSIQECVQKFREDKFDATDTALRMFAEWFFKRYSPHWVKKDGTEIYDWLGFARAFYAEWIIKHRDEIAAENARNDAQERWTEQQTHTNSSEPKSIASLLPRTREQIAQTFTALGESEEEALIRADKVLLMDR